MLHEPLRRNGRLKTKEAEGKKKVPGKQGKKDHLDQTDKSKSFNSPEARHLQFASPFKLCAGKPFQILLHVELSLSRSLSVSNRSPRTLRFPRLEVPLNATRLRPKRRNRTGRTQKGLFVEPKRRVACLDYVQKYDKSRQLFDTTLVLVSGPYNEPKL